HGFAHVALQLFFLVHDFHRAAAEYIRRAHDQREADFLRGGNRLLQRTHGGVGRLFQLQALDHLLEALAVFGAVDRIRRGADDGHAVGFEIARQFQRRLAAELHDHADRLFLGDDFEHVFERYRLEVQAIGSVVVSRNRFRVAVDHDGFIAIFAHRQRRMHAAIIELDTLADTVRATTQHQNLVARADIGFALFLVGRVHVGRAGRKFRRAGIDALVDRTNAKLVTTATQFLFADRQQYREPFVGETLAFQTEHEVRVDIRQCDLLQLIFGFDDIFD